MTTSNTQVNKAVENFRKSLGATREEESFLFSDIPKLPKKDLPGDFDRSLNVKNFTDIFALPSQFIDRSSKRDEILSEQKELKDLFEKKRSPDFAELNDDQLESFGLLLTDLETKANAEATVKGKLNEADAVKKFLTLIDNAGVKKTFDQFIDAENSALGKDEQVEVTGFGTFIIDDGRQFKAKSKEEAAELMKLGAKRL